MLGLADAAERAEFERLLAVHPELRTAMEEFEISLEKHALSSTLKPPAHLKSKILSSIEMDVAHEAAPSFTGGGSGVPPVIDGTGKFSGGNERSGAGVMMVKKDFTRLLAAAAVLLLLISTALNFYFFNRYKEYNQRYQALILSQTNLASHNQILQARILEYEKTVDMMKDPAMYIVKMPAMPASPDPTSATTVYWDTRTKDVYLAVNKLPLPAENQQYQLWAMVDGKPVDAGVFDVNGGMMTKMKNIPKAQAFAITLEKKGGSPVPTMDKLYVMGKV